MRGAAAIPTPPVATPETSVRESRPVRRCRIPSAPRRRPVPPSARKVPAPTTRRPVRSPLCRRCWCAGRRSRNVRSAGCPSARRSVRASCPRFPAPSEVTTPVPVTTTTGRPATIGVRASHAPPPNPPRPRRAPRRANGPTTSPAPGAVRRSSAASAVSSGANNRRRDRDIAASARLAGNDGSSEWPNAVAVHAPAARDRPGMSASSRGGRGNTGRAGDHRRVRRLR